MKAIKNIKLEKVINNYTTGYNNLLKCSEWQRIVYFNDESKFNLNELFRYIGNHELDIWSKVDKMKKSTSEKNIIKYLTPFLNQIEIIK